MPRLGNSRLADVREMVGYLRGALEAAERLYCVAEAQAIPPPTLTVLPTIGDAAKALRENELHRPYKLRGTEG